MKNKNKLINVLKVGDIIRFTNEGSNMPLVDNTYEVLTISENANITSLSENSKLRYIESLDPAMVGKIIHTDLTAYYHSEGSVFLSNRINKNKKGEVTWTSNGKIEILEIL